ncbi:class I adenylate-forming enzyme family protein [Paraburkholderia lycopersici]|uniref:Fatty-acyl-CoA synthase n=1 Tax=Paraburkholderia lycopersici TaxID=416944 RepID=A0A1G6QSA0_9BURK|nr:AMP-binding protein [Paraburkholderia lycopersici]SDC95259.1 fatty-acyl-CoA synthase [Paraburkholderia lycopersici]
MPTMPAARTVPRLLEDWAALDPAHEALVGGGERLNYGELLARVRETAAALHALGIGKGDRVAILMGNRVEWLVLAWAAQYIGAIAVGMNTWATAREFAYALQHSGVTLLAAAPTFLRQDFRAMLESIGPLAERAPELRHVVWVGEGDEAHVGGNVTQMSLSTLLRHGAHVAPATIDRLGADVSPDDAALLVYSSGSTSLPKGILLRQGALIENGWHIGQRQHVDENDRLWLAVSLFWSLGSANAAFNLLTHRGAIVLQESFNAADAIALIDSERCTVFYGTPNMVSAIAAQMPPGQTRLESLRTGVTIGSPDQIKRLAALGPQKICNVYGLTETYGNCAVTDADEPLDVRATTMGKPLPGFTVRVVDLDRGYPLPVGQVGELRIKGRMFAGYFNDEARTASSYDSDGFFRSGDLGMIDQHGQLIYRGRVTEMVKTGGINVAPAEVEETLTQHPAVESAFVVALPDTVNDEVLGAIVIARDGQEISEKSLEAFCRQSLAAYKVPRVFRILRESELPLTTTGKVKKAELKALFAQTGMVSR